MHYNFKESLIFKYSYLFVWDMHGVKTQRISGKLFMYSRKCKSVDRQMSRSFFPSLMVHLFLRNMYALCGIMHPISRTNEYIQLPETFVPFPLTFNLFASKLRVLCHILEYISYNNKTEHKKKSRNQEK